MSIQNIDYNKFIVYTQLHDCSYRL